KTDASARLGSPRPSNEIRPSIWSNPPSIFKVESSNSQNEPPIFKVSPLILQKESSRLQNAPSILKVPPFILQEESFGAPSKSAYFCTRAPQYSRFFFPGSGHGTNPFSSNGNGE